MDLGYGSIWYTVFLGGWVRTSNLPNPGGIVVPKDNSQAFIMMLPRGRAKVGVGEELSLCPCRANVRPELHP